MLLSVAEDRIPYGEFRHSGKRPGSVPLHDPNLGLAPTRRRYYDKAGVIVRRLKSGATATGSGGRLWDLSLIPELSRPSKMGVPCFVNELRKMGYPVLTIDKDCGVSLIQPVISGVPLSRRWERTFLTEVLAVGAY